ncbi:unnamed protein product, partial [Ectocarpus fasciculatus]
GYSKKEALLTGSEQTLPVAPSRPHPPPPSHQRPAIPNPTFTCQRRRRRRRHLRRLSRLELTTMGTTISTAVRIATIPRQSSPRRWRRACIARSRYRRAARGVPP